MKLKISLIFILIILIMVLTFGAVVNADEYIIKPDKVNYYDSIYSVTPGGSSFFDPDKTYNSFFSPYATSEVKVTSSLSCSFALYFSYDYISPSFNDNNFSVLKNDLIDSIRLLHHNGSGTYSYDIKVSDNYELTTGYIIVYFNITYNSKITIPSGTLGFYNVSEYDIWGPSFMISYSPLEYDYTFLSNAKVSRLWLNYINIECDYNLPIICTSNAFVLVLKSGFSTVVGGINPDSHIISKLLVNGIEIA